MSASPRGVLRSAPAVLLAVVVAGCGSATTSPTSGSGVPSAQPASPAHPSEAQSAVPAPYATASTTYPQLDPDAAIAATLAGMTGVTFDRLAIDPNPVRDSESAYVMHATIETESATTAAQIKAAWEACLADGALAERLAGDATDLEQVIVGLHIKAALPDGSTKEQGGCGGDVTPGEVFGAQAAGESDDQIRQSIAEVLADNGLTPIEVTILHPLGPAVAVIASADTTDSIDTQIGNVEHALAGDDYPYEGSYLEVRGPGGNALVVSATAFRAGTGFSVGFPSMGVPGGIGAGVGPPPVPPKSTKASARGQHRRTR